MIDIKKTAETLIDIKEIEMAHGGALSEILENDQLAAFDHAITILERVEKLPELIGTSPDPFQSDIVDYLQTGEWRW